MKRCKTCYGWINSKATRCKHCNAPVNDGKTSPDEQYINYINSGFSVIEKECAMFDAKIDSMKGSVCPHHEYSEEELIRSNHINNIKSIAGKMGSDVANWSAKGIISNTVKTYYETKMAILRQKMSYTLERVKFRKKTVWDNFGEFLLSGYYFVFNIAFYHFRNFVVPNMMNTSQAKNPFNVFGQAANFFENFMYDMMSNYAKEEPGDSRKRA
jgi:hypothetical protein